MYDDFYVDEFGDDFDPEHMDDEFMPQDPFDSLTKREQDTFFRVLDLLPREQLEYAMDYFMSNPAKIRTVIDYVKEKKEIIKEGDEQALRDLFDREKIFIEGGNTTEQE